MKAYEVRFEDEAKMVFAETPGKARQKARLTFFEADWTEINVRRLPEGDKYFGQKITEKILFDCGFFFERKGAFLDKDWELNHNKKVIFDDNGRILVEQTLS